MGNLACTEARRCAAVTCPDYVSTALVRALGCLVEKTVLAGSLEACKRSFQRYLSLGHEVDDAWTTQAETKVAGNHTSLNVWLREGTVNATGRLEKSIGLVLDHSWCHLQIVGTLQFQLPSL